MTDIAFILRHENYGVVTLRFKCWLSMAIIKECYIETLLRIIYRHFKVHFHSHYVTERYSL